MDLEQVLLASGKDVLSSGKKAMHLPALASDALTGLTKGRTKLNLEMTGYEELVNKAAMRGCRLRTAASYFVWARANDRAETAPKSAAVQSTVAALL